MLNKDIFLELACVAAFAYFSAVLTYIGLAFGGRDPGKDPKGYMATKRDHSYTQACGESQERRGKPVLIRDVAKCMANVFNSQINALFLTVLMIRHEVITESAQFSTKQFQ